MATMFSGGPRYLQRVSVTVRNSRMSSIRNPIYCIQKLVMVGLAPLFWMLHYSILVFFAGIPLPSSSEGIRHVRLTSEESWPSTPTNSGGPVRYYTSPSPSIVYNNKQKIQPLGHENSLTGWKLQTQMLSLGKTCMNFSSCSTFLF